MSEIITERTGNILRVHFNRPAIGMADLLNSAAKEDHLRVVFWHGQPNSEFSRKRRTA